MKAGQDLRDELLTRVGIRLSSGIARFYDGAQPADSDTALGGNTLIVQCDVTGYSVDGGRIALTLGAGVCVAAGTPTFARFLQFGFTVEFDMTVGTDLVLSKADWAGSEAFPGMTVNIQLPVGT